MLRVELPAGAAGARVTAECAGLAPQTAEFAVGGGYASQGPPLLWFGLGSGAREGKISVRWPNGKTSEEKFSGTRIKLAAPR